jgi:glycine dehydrogenase subunit 1
MPYFSLTDADRTAMLATIGVDSVDDLFADIPATLREKAHTAFQKIGAPYSELAIKREFGAMATNNQSTESAASFLGAGYYDHFIPAVVPALASRGEFLTAYTPYQAETSQGTLQVIYEFQTLLCQLTGMEMANASLYDGATALAEAIIVATSATRKKRVLIPRTVSPSFRRVAQTYTQGLPLSLEEIAFDSANGTTDLEALKAALETGDVAAVVVAQPNFFGAIEDVQAISEAAHKAGALLISVFNPISLGILPPPGEYDADIAVADGQSLGLSLSFGGPGLGLYCCKQKYARLAPGRLVGLTTDENGKRGFTLTLQTREQHIRREKATSNICSNQALCALTSTIFLSAIGPDGLEDYAKQSFHKAHFLQKELENSAFGNLQAKFSGEFFHEFAIELPVTVAQLNQELAEMNIIGPYDLGRDYPELENVALFCCTEKRSRHEIEDLVEAIEALLEIDTASSDNLSLNGHA